MYLGLLLCVLAQASEPRPPAVVESRRFTDVLGTGSAQVSVSGGVPRLYVSDGKGTNFYCDQFGSLGVNYTRKSFAQYADLLTEVQQHLEDGADLDFDPAKKGGTYSSAEGYCNMSAVIRSGQALVVFSHNRACFGSAGCNRDSAVLALNGTSLGAFATALHWAAAR